MPSQIALTTIDNPFNPFDDFLSWFLFDEEKGHHTCAYLGRIARTSDSLSDEENAEEIEKAIDEIIKFDFMNIYKKLKRSGEEKTTKIEGKTVENLPIDR